MRVHPAQNQAGPSATDVYGTVPVIKRDLVIIVNKNKELHAFAERICNVLKLKTKLHDITCFDIDDAENDKFKNRTGKVLFLLSEEQTNVIQLMAWIDALKRNNRNKLRSFFVSVRQANPGHQVLGISYETENNSVAVQSLDRIFLWWPQFLREMFGSGDHHPHAIRLKLVELLSSNTSDNQLVEFVKEEFSVYEDEEMLLEDANKVIVLTDRPIEQLPEEMKKSLRDSKLNGANIYLVGYKNETFQNTSSHKTISTYHYPFAPSSTMDFVIDVLIDFGILKDKLRQLNLKKPVKPAGPIHFQNVTETSAVLVWGLQDVQETAETNIVIRQKLWYDGKWTIVEENLPSYINGYEVKGLDTLSEMYIFSVVRESEHGVSGPLVTSECSLMVKKLHFVTLLKVVSLYGLAALVLLLNVLQSLIGIAFALFLVMFAIGIYSSYCALCIVLHCFISTSEETDDCGSPAAPPSSLSMHSEVLCCVCGIIFIASKLIIQICFGDLDKTWQYLVVFGVSFLIISIGFVANLATDFSGIVLAIFLITLVFGIGWCMVVHFLLISKLDIENGVYGLSMMLKDMADNLHLYRFQKAESTPLDSVQVDNA